MKILTAKNSRAKCYVCKEPLVKKEGCTYGMYNGGKYRCYKCSSKAIRNIIERYEEHLKQLKKSHHIGEKRLNEQKIVRML